jgi:hypothetical protein
MSAPNTQDLHKAVGDELRLLYSTAISEIAGFKQQQWHIANYGMLLYAAIASSPRLFSSKLDCLEIGALAISAIVVFIAGWMLIGMFTASIHVRRERLTFIRNNYFTVEFKQAWRAGKSIEEMPDLPEEKAQLQPLFRSVFAIGLLVTLWILWRTYSSS